MSISGRGVQRRLAAIMFADVVGYSRMMAEDEAATLAMVLSLRRQVIEPRIAAHGGRVFATMGDGVVAEFRSAVEAVECAVDIQRELTAGQMYLGAGGSTPILRVGVNLGDVSVQADGGVYGDGTNVAARLQALASPGSVLISEDVYRQLAGRASLPFENRGEQILKNIPHPVRTYELEADAIAALPEPRALSVFERERPLIPSRRTLTMGGGGLAATAALGGWWWRSSVPPMIHGTETMATSPPPHPTEQPRDTISNPRILCACSGPYSLPDFQFNKDIAHIESAFPGRSYVRRNLTSQMLRDLLTRQQFDLVHLAVAVDRDRGDLVFNTFGAYAALEWPSLDRMSPEAFSNLLAAARTRLVVILSCRSLLLAVEVAHVANVITSDAEITGDQAAGWGEVFYDLIAKGHSLYNAFRMARDADTTPMRLVRHRDVAFASEADRVRAGNF